MKVLFIDDEPDLLDQAKIFLEKEDNRITVETTTSAREALQLIRKDDFDAVVADYKLPDMDGIELLAKLRKEGNNITFIILTGRGSEKVKKDSLEKGADQYITKGGSPKPLYQSIADTIIQKTE
ncbi:hypothetical protein AKJ37_01095 [candidate division MSBL1 archaeon SCGC-AAA259I09]|uniref:Response regulatory domain-containing protein n=1 Tax=candidate division MSBL1 archaeon SCGC-AAA259I09 TaxID=1698267 RepID=A0A133UVB7_9EURY|nr:hypothetical protein AKJ37_01095 [candidate division MSBL1 archaeon SCGC-AAA259I09]